MPTAKPLKDLGISKKDTPEVKACKKPKGDSLP